MRLTKDFYCRDVLEVAPDLIGKTLVRRKDHSVLSYMITEVEAYRGEEDEACHARFGQTRRNRIMYESGGLLYVYLVYGMHWMLNIVTGQLDVPQAALIRGITGFDGPGKLTKSLAINNSFYGEDLTVSDRIWLDNNSTRKDVLQTSRIGIRYAAEPWRSMPWRFLLKH